MRRLMALAVLVGCSGGSDKTPTFSGRQATDEATLEGKIYYIDLSVADTPLTESELNDPEGAIPIRLLAGEDFVVAVGLDPALGSMPMDRVMGIWTLQRDLPGGGETEGEGGDTTTSGGGGLIVDWDHDVADIEPDEFDALIYAHPGCL